MLIRPMSVIYIQLLLREVYSDRKLLLLLENSQYVRQFCSYVFLLRIRITRLDRMTKLIRLENSFRMLREKLELSFAAQNTTYARVAPVRVDRQQLSSI